MAKHTLVEYAYTLQGVEADYNFGRGHTIKSLTRKLNKALKTSHDEGKQVTDIVISEMTYIPLSTGRGYKEHEYAKSIGPWSIADGP
jgi:hypothetical protein